MLTWTLAIFFSLSASVTPLANAAPPPDCTEGALRQHPLGGARFLECVDGALRQRWCAPGRVFSAHAGQCLPFLSDPRGSGGARKHLSPQGGHSRYTSRSLSSSLSGPGPPLIPRRNLERASSEPNENRPKRSKKRNRDYVSRKFARRFNDEDHRSFFHKQLVQKIPRVPSEDSLIAPATRIGCHRKGARPDIEGGKELRERTQISPNASSGSHKGTSQAQRKGVPREPPPITQHPRQSGSTSFKGRPLERASLRVFPFSRTPANFKSTRKKCARKSTAADLFPGKLSTKVPGRMLTDPPRLQVQQVPVSNSPAKHPAEEGTTTLDEGDDVLFLSRTEKNGQVTQYKKERMSKTAPPKVDTDKTLISNRTRPAQAVSEEPIKSSITPPYFPLRPYVDTGTATSTVRALPLPTIQDDLRGTTNVGSGSTKRKNAIRMPPKDDEELEDSLDKDMDVKVEHGTAVQNFRLSSAPQVSEHGRSQERSLIDLLSPSSVQPPVIKSNEEYTSATISKKPAEEAPEITSSPDLAQSTVQLLEKLRVLSAFRSQTKSSSMKADKMSSVAPKSTSGIATVAKMNTEISSSGPDLVSRSFPVPPALASSTVFVKASEALLQASPPDSPSFTDENDLRYTAGSSWAEDSTHATLPPSTEIINSTGSYPGLTTRNETDLATAYVTVSEHGATSPTKQTLAGADLSVTQMEIATEPSPALTSPRKPFTSFISTHAGDLPSETSSAWAGSYTHATVAPFTEALASPASYTDFDARSETGLASTYMKILDHGVTSPSQQRLKEPDLSFTQAETATPPSPVLTSVSKAYPSSFSTETSDTEHKDYSSYTHATVASFTEGITSPSSYADLAAQNEVSLASTYVTVWEHEATPPTQLRLRGDLSSAQTETGTTAALVLTSVSKPFTSLISTTSLPQPEAPLKTDISDSMEAEPLLPGNAHPKEEEHEWDRQAKQTEATASDSRETVSRSTAHVHNRHSEVRILSSLIVSTVKPAVYSTRDSSSLTILTEGSVEPIFSERNRVDRKQFTTTKDSKVTKQFLDEKATDRVSEATQTTFALDGRFSTQTLGVERSESARNADTLWPHVHGTTFVLPENHTQDSSLSAPSNEEASFDMAGFPTYGVNTALLLSTATSPDTLLPSHTNQTHSSDANFDQYVRINESTGVYENFTSSELSAKIPANISHSNDSSFFPATQINSSKQTPSYFSGNFTGVGALFATSITAEAELLHGTIAELQNDNDSLHREGVTGDNDLSLSQQSLELHLSKSSGRSLVRNPLLTMHLSTLSSKQANVATHSEMHPSNDSSSDHTTTSPAPENILSLPPSVSAPDETRPFTRPSSLGDTENVTSTDAAQRFGTAPDGGTYSSGDGETSSSKVTDAVLLLTTEQSKQPPGREAEGTGKNSSTMVISQHSPRVHVTAPSTMELNRNSLWPHSERASDLTHHDALLVSTPKNSEEDVTIASTVSTPSATSRSVADSRRISLAPSTTSAKTEPSTSDPQIEEEEVTKAPVCKSTFGLFRHPENCNLFVHCSNSVPYVKKCPANLHFNEKYMVCDYPYRAGCVSNLS